MHRGAAAAAAVDPEGRALGEPGVPSLPGCRWEELLQVALKAAVEEDAAP